MTITTTKSAVNLREQLAARKAKPITMPRRFDFSNLVVNGTFSADSDWTKGTGWTIGSGVATKTAGTLSNLQQGDPTTIGRRYSAGFAVSGYTAGNVYYYAGGANQSGNKVANGSYSFAYTTTTKTNLYITGDASFVGSIDDVYIWEADPSDDAPWLRLPTGYYVGDYGMIVCDGVVLHPGDYEEIFDGHTTFIKPATAPGVSTTYSVWGVQR